MQIREFLFLFPCKNYKTLEKRVEELENQMKSSDIKVQSLVERNEALEMKIESMNKSVESV